MRRLTVIVLVAILVPVAVCGVAVLVGWVTTHQVGGSGSGEVVPPGATDRLSQEGTVAEREGPGFVEEAHLPRGKPPIPAATSVPGQLRTAAFEVHFPPDWVVATASNEESSGWEWSRPDQPNSAVRLRRYDNKVSSSGQAAARQGAEGDRRAGLEGRLHGYRHGQIELTSWNGRPAARRTAIFTVDGRTVEGEQWLTTGIGGAVVALTTVVAEPDDPAPYRALAHHLVNGGAQVR